MYKRQAAVTGETIAREIKIICRTKSSVCLLNSSIKGKKSANIKAGVNRCRKQGYQSYRADEISHSLNSDFGCKK